MVPGFVFAQRVDWAISEAAEGPHSHLLRVPVLTVPHSPTAPLGRGLNVLLDQRSSREADWPCYSSLRNAGVCRAT